ncbi:MAG: cobalt-precorrin-5B (C(1))-methyltransferase [Bacteroidaceae bacterium]|nr:cobalt-precorrin-5B (C(1))-methyltransferase [Bacteroidaceae bacterium]
MILIFGGTTEGRIAAETLDDAGKPFYYSTKSGRQEVAMRHGIQITGAMTQDDIVTFCKEHAIVCMVDAAHPFAENLHKTIAEAARKTSIPVIRLLRPASGRIKDATYCKTYDEAIAAMEQQGVKRLLALSGANTISKLKPFWQHHETFFRILHRQESIDIADRNGFSESNLLFYNEDNELPSIEDETAMMQSVHADAIITKDSGENGGMPAKTEAAHRLGIKIFVIEPPVLPASFIIVTGKYTLRRAIEGLSKDFFPLRTGITTGACATAATKGALLALLTGEPQEEVSFALPDGEILTIPITETIPGDGYAECIVTKDAGDDPDVTNGCRVHSHVSHGTQGIRFIGGSGVGTVTLPGLGLEVGGPAINNTPRQMMTNEIRALSDKDYDVTISVEGGEEIAKRTFNSKVGVVGGISIIGTSGIVSPLSNEAFIESLRRELQVAKAIGTTHIIFVSGKKAEEALKAPHPTKGTAFQHDENNTLFSILDKERSLLTPPSGIGGPRFIHYGNAIGEALKAAYELGFRKVTLGIMIGKAVKVAEGNLDTHSHKVTMNKEFLRQLAGKDADKIDGITMARELWDIMPQAFFDKIHDECYHHCRSVFPDGTLNVKIIKNE